MIKYYLLPLAALLIYCLPAKAQHHDLDRNATMWAGKKRPHVQDTLSLLQSFKSGTTHGHFRYYFMATDNTEELTDYYANAIGGGIRYELHLTKDFNFALVVFIFSTLALLIFPFPIL